MSRENVVKFYEEVNKNEKIRKEFENLKNKVEKGTKEESLAKEVVSIAKNNGFNFTEKELKSYTKELKGILSEDELLSVSGGIDIKKIGLMGTMILACAAGTAAISSSAMGQEVQQSTASASASVEAGKSSRKMQNVKINKVEVTNPYSLSPKYRLRVTVDTNKSFSVTKDLIEKIAEKVEHGWINKSVGIDPSLIEEIEFVRTDKGAVTLNKISKVMREKGIELRGNVAILGEDTYKKIKAEENVAEPAVSADFYQEEQTEEEEAQSRASVEKANEELDKKEDFTRELNKVLGKWSPNVIKKDLARVQQLINEANNKVRDSKLERIPKLQQQIKSAQDAFGEAQSAVIEANKKIVDVKKQTIGFEEVRKAIESANKAVEKAKKEAKKAAEEAAQAKKEAEQKAAAELAQKSHKIDKVAKKDEKITGEKNPLTISQVEKAIDPNFVPDEGSIDLASSLSSLTASGMGLPSALDLLERKTTEDSDQDGIGDKGTVAYHENPVEKDDAGTVVIHKDSDKVEESGYDSGTRIIKDEQKTKNGEPEAERPRFEFKQVQIPMQKLNEDGKLYKTLKEMGVTEDEFKKSVEGFAGLLDGIRARALGDGSKQRPGLILRDLNDQTGVGPLLLGAPRIVNMLNTPNDSVIELIKEYIRNNPGDNIFTTLFGDGVLRIFERESDTIEDVKEQAQKLKNLSTFAKVFYKYLDLSDLEGSLDLSSLLPEVGANATEGTLRTSMRGSLRTSMKREKGSPEILNNDKIRALREIVLGKKGPTKTEKAAAEAAKREAEKKAAAEAPLQVKEVEKPIYMTGKKYDLDVSKLPNKFNGGTIKGAKIYLYHSDPRYTVFDFDDIYNACLIYGLDPTGCTSAVVQQGTYGGLNKTIPLNYEKMQKLSKVDAIRKQLPELVNACEYNSENHEGGRNYINYWIKEKEIPSTLERDKLFMKFLLEGIRERFDLNDEIDGVQLYFNNSWHSYNFIDYED